MNRKQILNGYLAVLVSAVIFGCMPLMVKRIYADGMNSLSVVFLRNLLSLPVVALLALGRNKTLKIDPKALPSVALIGALGEGDIGRHFPDSDPAYKGISSMLLLEHVMKLVQSRGFAVINADVTIVAQKPKLAAYIPQMKQNIIDALGTENVNVKATTTERMGFEGEEIGISSQAAVLLGM